MNDFDRLQCPYCGEWLDLGCPGVEVYRHEDGSEDEFDVAHTMNDEQIEWFRAGSALNLLRKQP